MAEEDIMTENEKIHLLVAAHNDTVVYASAHHAYDIAIQFARDAACVLPQHVDHEKRILESDLLANFMLLFQDFHRQRNEEIVWLKQEVARLRGLITEPMVLPKK